MTDWQIHQLITFNMQWRQIRSFQKKRFSGLRFQIVGIVGLVFLVLFCGQFAIARMILLHSFLELEDARVLRNTERLQAALAAELATIETSAIDEATWDATYSFVEQPNLTHIEKNLPITTLSDNELSLLLILHHSGRIAYGQGYNRAHHLQVPVAAGLWPHIAPGSPLLSPAETGVPLSGILRLPEGPLLVAAVPILTSEATGPVQGTYLMGRFFDHTVLARLARKTQLSLQLYDYYSPLLPADLQAQKISFTSLDAIRVQPLDHSTLASYLLISDITGEPAYVLKATMPREFYAQGLKSLRYYLVSTFVISVIFLALCLLLFERMVLSRLSILSQAVRRIGQSNDWSIRLPLLDNTELSRFAATINHMLDHLVRSQSALRESEERYALAAKGSKDGLWDWNLKTKTVYLSTRAAKILGCPHRQSGWSLSALRTHIYSGDLTRFRTAMQAHLRHETRQFSGEFRLSHRPGSYRWVMVRGLAIRDEQGKAYRMAGSLTDLSKHRAFYDELTGLPNRRLFLEQLKRLLWQVQRQPGYRFAVLFLDCDRFKVINDSLGHSAGDRLLQVVAQRLESCLQPGDMVARIGGDEFIILLENIADIQAVTRTAERLNRTLLQPIELENQTLYVSASIGIALNPADEAQPERLLRNADMAMYQAKAMGRAQYAIFDHQMHAQVRRVMQLETSLRQAIEQEKLQLYYQPIVSLETAELMGFEALVRWQHPERGPISPAEFIPLAEETGLIFPLGRWVIRQACQQLQTWRQLLGLSESLSIAVNLSRRQLSQSNLAAEIEAILQATGLPPYCLTLEITETALVDNDLAAEQRLKELQGLGVSLAIDDFGTGYSSLIYLHRFPIDMLKIDRAFVKTIGSQQQNLAIIQAIISLAHGLGIDTVAEGIETAEQRSVVQALGCDRAQGYLFYEALPASEIAALLGQSVNLLGPSVG
ncbi:MAG: EAL domain-containing protein [Leptolyngbya sp. SIO4C1]|nr:EAL domain-containing protein [Leptolyngbya sp. SIO4C1]